MDTTTSPLASIGIDIGKEVIPPRRRIIPTIYVKPFVKGQKNDYNDAEATGGGSSRKVVLAD